MKTLEKIEPRMKQPAMIMPEAMQLLQSLGKLVHESGVPRATLAMVELRASQLNGCSFCVDMHSRDLKRMNVPEAKIWGVGAWRENPAFEPAERAALALAESLTRIDDTHGGVPDVVWEEAANHYDEKSLAALVLGIASINVWNRLNVAVRQPAGAWRA